MKHLILLGCGLAFILLGILIDNIGIVYTLGILLALILIPLWVKWCLSIDKAEAYLATLTPAQRVEYNLERLEERAEQDLLNTLTSIEFNTSNNK
jgi:hypothetical protein